jgi:hypothetical protein
MESIMTYPDKGYDVEIWLCQHDKGVTYTADIKYPCGELVQGMECIASKRNAVYWAVCEIEKLPYANHEGCKDEYCKDNRYLQLIRGK